MRCDIFVELCVYAYMCLHYTRYTIRSVCICRYQLYCVTDPLNRNNAKRQRKWYESKRNGSQHPISHFIYIDVILIRNKFMYSIMPSASVLIQTRLTSIKIVLSPDEKCFEPIFTFAISTQFRLFSLLPTVDEPPLWKSCIDFLLPFIWLVCMLLQMPDKFWFFVIKTYVVCCL